MARGESFNSWGLKREMATKLADKTYTPRLMEVVDTTTIRVRRSTQERLAEEASLAGIDVTELLEKAADAFEEDRLREAEEQRLLEGFVRCYEEHGDAIMAEMKDWLDMPGSPPPDDNWPDAPPNDD